ncbi:MAG: retroviral-like aspartic protease family protein [Planctomycetales bacterium]|nr:retroviral-like aspartic protease family protein [Planctomycetales bacterium]
MAVLWASVEFVHSLAVSRRQALAGISALAAGSALSSYRSRDVLSADAKETNRPEERLQKGHGLIRLSGGVWGLPLEAELKEKLAQLPILRESVVLAEKELGERAEANRLAWKESAPAMETLKQALGRLSPTDPQRTALTQQLAALETNISEPSRLSCRGEIRARLVAFSRDRSLLQLALLWIRAQAPRLAEEYARLAKLPEVTAALKQLGNEKLGPLKNYAPEVKRLTEYDKLVFTDWLPAYQQAGQTRLSAIVNEQAPVTFTWSEESDGKLLLPAGVLEPCGLALPKNSSPQTIKVADRTLIAHQLTVPTLRLGRHVAKNLTAWILPPEGEDLGPRLPRQALTGLRINIELDRLRLTVTA